MTAPASRRPGQPAAPTVRGWLAGLRARLGTEAAPLEAQMLACRVLGQPRSWLFAHGETRLGASQIAELERLAARRLAGEPMAYILGRRAFWDMELSVSPAVLIPRPETEALVELALAHLRGIVEPQVVDLGTGSGAIAIAVARARPDARVLATDASEQALAVARENVRALAPGRVRLQPGDWFRGLEASRFHLVLANPPYLASGDPHLLSGDLRFEPRRALAAGASGLDALRAIAAGVTRQLLPGGRVLLEHAFDQGAAVRGLLGDAGLREVRTHRDLAGRERVTTARRAGQAAPAPVQ